MSVPADLTARSPPSTAMLLINHPSGLFQAVAGMPVIRTASVPQPPGGPLVPETLDSDRPLIRALTHPAPRALFHPRRHDHGQ
ncbi:hypothetical protein [Dyella sp. EPa41]|uniref:hypothetical protein n=1 Tax=Dyella sp. EPa41 TaxID=1561194 RepID=UPI001916A24E|nr:hypothetical protein [Dyella sp. EPa41]